jgi:hypothetical protein
LVTVNPAFGIATFVGLIGFPNVFGLDYTPAFGLLGADNQGDILSISQVSGTGTVIHNNPGVAFTGLA